MIIDIHIHERTYSHDSIISLEEIIERASEIGLDGVCITDHDNQNIMERANEYAKITGFLILVGAEILTYEGDLLVFGMKEIPGEMRHAQEIIDITKKDGGVAISAHPFRKNNRGLGDNIRNVNFLSGVECYNGSTKPVNNILASSLAAELNMPAFGSSDAHHKKAIGKYATAFPGLIRDIQDFIEAVKIGNTYPVIYNGSEYLKIYNCNQLHNDKDMQ